MYTTSVVSVTWEGLGGVPVNFKLYPNPAWTTIAKPLPVARPY
jgi:hypothetical protein